ncbi:hypothetical protein SLEP1_g13377 [Rubroshorea leprosula]|uniref:Uncharacterized protein n=1 Tax=Rubroshorea leprosula TaxID=152421 RepID=A0AAV5IFN9_9ROSI|nr:hypothetical protein SLEP1_g13377 [Rubroshorea leprosula]
MQICSAAAAQFGEGEAAAAQFGEGEAAAVWWRKARKMSCDGLERVVDGGG